MSYHVENPRFKELPEQLIVREDGYMDAYRNEGEPIVDYVYTLRSGTCQNVSDLSDDKSRWAELFGTPERAARTLHELCGGCCGLPENVRDDYDALLEWLRGEGESDEA